jgi:hypothetical protein
MVVLALAEAGLLQGAFLFFLAQGTRPLAGLDSPRNQGKAKEIVRQCFDIGQLEKSH